MTLNINGITSDTKIRMLEALLWKQGIDIALIQEVTNNKINTLRGYTCYINEGTEKRGTVIVLKDGINITEIKRIPTGRGITVKHNDLWTINIYAPSGAERKAEREHFYNTELTYILTLTHNAMILAGDFNCNIDKTDSTGAINYSRALNNIVQGLGLIDGWETTKTRGGYTHYTAKSASRIDRIYATTVMKRKTGIETLAAAFTDHNAVIIRIAIDTPLPTRGRGYWKMNTQLLQGRTFCEKLQNEWEKWETQKKHYPTSVMWWKTHKKKNKTIHSRRGRATKRSSADGDILLRSNKQHITIRHCRNQNNKTERIKGQDCTVARGRTTEKTTRHR
jgi:exonuclease III